jgi:DNA-binding beta-propeller fold protein YncE
VESLRANYNISTSLSQDIDINKMLTGSLAVVSQTGSSLSFFDLATGARTAHITDLIPEPHELLFDHKRGLLYLTHAYRHGHFWFHGENGCEISVIDPIQKKVVDIINIHPALGPHGLAHDTSRDILWCSYEEHETASSGGLVGIDLNTRKVIKRVESSTKTHWFVMTPDGTKAYTCNKNSPFISILDLENQRMVGKIDAPGTEECSISLDGTRAFFPTPGTQIGKNPENPGILVIDTASNMVVRTISLEFGAQSVHVTGDGRLMVGEYRFDTNATSGNLEQTVQEGQLAVYDSRTYELCGRTLIGKMPLTMRSSPDGKLGFVANIFSGSVTVVDLVNFAILNTIIVDPKVKEISKMCQGAHGLSVLPRRFITLS